MMSDLWIPLGLSLKVAGWATLFAAVLGIGGAYLLSRWRSPWSNVVDSIFTLPLVLPPTVIGYYLLVVFGRRGWLGQWLSGLGIELVFTWQGAVLAATIVAFPLVLKSSRAAFEGVDSRLENAGMTLGLSQIEVFFRISLPLALRGIMAGVLLAFARALGEFGATLMIAGSIPGRTQTLSIAIYEAVQVGNDELALIMVLVISLSCVAVLCLAGLLTPAPPRRGVQ